MAISSKPLPPQTKTQILVLLASILLLRSSIASGPRYVLSKLKVAARGRRLTPQELLHVLQQVYVKAEDGSKTLLVLYREAYISKVRSNNKLTTCVASVIPNGITPGHNTPDTSQQIRSGRTLLSPAFGEF